MFFQERGISFQYINMKEKAPSAGEWNRIFKSLKPELLLDTAGKRYKNAGYAWKLFDPAEALAGDPLLAITPIIRSESGVTSGYKPEIWKTWKGE
jgi:arsenate reductase-like glutaredoxin family protein